MEETKNEFRLDCLERKQDQTDTEIKALRERVAVTEADVKNVNKAVDEIKEGQKWSTRFSLATMITVFLAVAGWLMNIR